MRVICISIMVCGCLLASCNAEQEISAISITYDFTSADNGWTGDFSDYPEGDSSNYQLFYKHDTLPTNLNANATKKALHLSGDNKSDDLFMFVKKKISGLKPNASYEILFNIKMASNASTNSIDVIGSPGVDVHLKAGASIEEPKKILKDGYYEMNIDKGNHAVGGIDMITIGHVGVTATTTQFTIISRYNNNSNSFIGTTNNEGEIWVIIGTDSDYEGPSNLYYSQIDVLLSKL